ncbi:MAG: SAM-dependent DNA methyltransferase [Acidobacteriota bacterium]|nr:SAM-dependent DNA methyltransferase [Acidobacteriota bacterium]
MPEPIIATLASGLEQIGYSGPRLERNYSFPDWFSGQKIRSLQIAAFGQTPVSYETACVGVAEASGGGLRELWLINSLRAFGAPLVLEIDGSTVREWAVSRVPDKHILVGTYEVSQLRTAIAERANDWKPESLLRAKNVGSFKWSEQLGLFSGLIPELEDRIQTSLDPLLRETLSLTRAAYVDSAHKPPSARDLFKLVFWVLTAKVFRDRQVQGFATLPGDADQILAAVAKHYRSDPPRLLNRDARNAAALSVWRELDFRNLSVEVLAHIWSKTLVDRDTRKRLGIHRTPRAIVRYIVERIPFPAVSDEDRIIFEPCSGSAAFLIGALNYLRPNLVLASPQERHRYFTKHLSGMEFDPFGIEISVLALTLADFPNPNGWNIRKGDVFAPGSMAECLRKAGAVLCNPPFEALNQADRAQYGSTQVRKPAELLCRVLADLHPQGVLGFVLPYTAVDGRPYASTRRMLAERFSSLELTVLPERSFEDAEADIAILIAKDPIPHKSTKVTFRRVNDSENDWQKFRHDQTVSTSYEERFTSDRAKRGLILGDLAGLWSYLAEHRRLGQIAEVHRGIEWKSTITPGLHIRETSAPGYMLGVPPKAKFNAFQVPPLKYLNVQPEEQRRNSWRHDWSQPKAIVPKARVSRGHWRIVAFADRIGITCHSTFDGVWPTVPEYDEVTLAAILNSPVASAFVATREGSRDVTAEVLRLIPVPKLSKATGVVIHDLVRRYEEAINRLMVPADECETLLKHIDAVVVGAYNMPPSVERRLFDYFDNHNRKVGHTFHNYFPATLDVFMHLSEYLSDKFSRTNVGELLKKSTVR